MSRKRKRTIAALLALVTFALGTACYVQLTGASNNKTALTAKAPGSTRGYLQNHQIGNRALFAASFQEADIEPLLLSDLQENNESSGSAENESASQEEERFGGSEDSARGPIVLASAAGTGADNSGESFGPGPHVFRGPSTATRFSSGSGGGAGGGGGSGTAPPDEEPAPGPDTSTGPVDEPGDAAPPPQEIPSQPEQPPGHTPDDTDPPPQNPPPQEPPPEVPDIEPETPPNDPPPYYPPAEPPEDRPSVRVPEPTTLVLMGTALAALGLGRRRRR